MTFEDLTKILLTWPLVESSTSYGTPSFKVKGKLLTRLREDGDSLLIKDVGPEERETLCRAFPDLYYFTDHYRDYPMVLIRLSRADPDTVTSMLDRTYRSILPKSYRQTIDSLQGR
ncbi:MmcQ/YjbR family DNA-binding protein [Rhizobium sp.]